MNRPTLDLLLGAAVCFAGAALLMALLEQSNRRGR